ncbi:MAG: dihydrofolate reductase [Paludibacteraceae bacterium]
MISIIVAIAQNMAIGKNNDLLWHLPADLKHFKQLTSGNTVIMGERTFFSLPIRPLPKRRNIVITDKPDLQLDGCEMAHSIDEAQALCRHDDENFVIGGGSIYRQFMALADTLYITWVYRDFEADTFYPEIDQSVWEQTDLSERMYDAEADLEFAFATYKRRSAIH